jgi:hypothetical protein
MISAGDLLTLSFGIHGRHEGSLGSDQRLDVLAVRLQPVVIMNMFDLEVFVLILIACHTSDMIEACVERLFTDYPCGVNILGVFRIRIMDRDRQSLMVKKGKIAHCLVECLLNGRISNQDVQS